MNSYTAALNPYTNSTFFHFFSLFFQRLWLFLTGKLPFIEIANDEVQLIVLVAIALSCSLLGVILVLRRMTMLANALSHTVLLGIVLAFLLLKSSVEEIEFFPLSYNTMLLAALLSGIATTFFTQLLTNTFKLQKDASIGLVFTAIFALAIILVTLLTRNNHIGVEAVMGNADALVSEDIFLSVFIFLLNGAIITLFFKEYLITTFDPAMAAAMGISPKIYNYILMALTSMTVVGAFRAVGVLMVLALLTAPPIIARLFTANLKKMIVLSMAIGSFSAFVGVALARHFLSVYGLAFSTSGLVVSTLGLFFLFSTLFSKRNIMKILIRTPLEFVKRL